MSKLIFHVPESGGYTVATLNDEEVYRGDDRAGPLLWEILEWYGIGYETREYRDILYEEKFS